MNFKLSALRAATAALALSTLAAPALASTDFLTVPLNFSPINIPSVGLLGDPGNYVTTLYLAPGAQVTGISWNVGLSASAPSWISEITLALSNSAQSAGYLFTPSPTAEQSGTVNSFGSLQLGANSFAVGSNGQLRLEFYDAWDDESVTPDGTWLGGTITFEVSAVPEPATYASLALGLVAIGAAARRRSAR